MVLARNHKGDRARDICFLAKVIIWGNRSGELRYFSEGNQSHDKLPTILPEIDVRISFLKPLCENLRFESRPSLYDRNSVLNGRTAYDTDKNSRPFFSYNISRAHAVGRDKFSIL